MKKLKQSQKADLKILKLASDLVKKGGSLTICHVMFKVGKTQENKSLK